MNNKSTQGPLQTERGVALVEYVILVALIAMMSIAGAKALGQSVNDMFIASSDAVEGTGTWNPG